jgi:hypothetical protein
MPRSPPVAFAGALTAAGELTGGSKIPIAAGG